MGCFLLVPALATAQKTTGAAYLWTTIAGASSYGSADGVGDHARFGFPYGLTVDSNGNIYVADTFNGTVREITAAGVVTTIAGFARAFGLADGTNSAARFEGSKSIVVDGTGALYIADGGLIRRAVRVGTNWVVNTLAGKGSRGTADGTNNAAQFNDPHGIAVGPGGELFVADTGNSTIRKAVLLGTNWVVTTIAGAAMNAGSLDGTNSNARFNQPQGMAIDCMTNLYVADAGNNTIRQIFPVSTNWVVTTIVGLAGNPGTSDGSNSAAKFNSPSGIAADAAGNLYVADTENDTIRKIKHFGANWVVTTIAGSPGFTGSVDGTQSNAVFSAVESVAVDTGGNIYAADTFNNTIRKITSAGVVTTLAGLANDSGNADGVATEARFYSPAGVAVTSSGNVYVADSENGEIREITPAGEVTTLAGSGSNFGSSDGAGSYAQFNFPMGLAIDTNGNIFIADMENYTIRKLSPSGVVTTIAGSAGIPGTADGTNDAAHFGGPGAYPGYGPLGLAVDDFLNVYVGDTVNNTIRKIKPMGTNWVVTTIAGLAGASGSADGMNSTARFLHPWGLAVDTNGVLYVADSDNYTIRKITPMGTNWLVSTIAGSAGNLGSADGLNNGARFGSAFAGYITNAGPAGLAIDAAGNVYATDPGNQRICRITPIGTNWLVTTIGGTGFSGSRDGVGTEALFSEPRGIALDRAGDIYVADYNNNTIRKGIFSAYNPTYPPPYSPRPARGTLSVTLLPAEADGQWRFPWELGWRESGAVATNLAVDNSHLTYTVEIRSLPGWLAFPSSFQVTVTTNGIISITTNVYYPTINSVNTNTAGGTLTVTLGANPPTGAGWRFLGGQGTNYLPSDYTTNLLPGTYLIEFAGPFTNRTTPSNLSVEVLDGQPTLISVNYLLSQSPPTGLLLPRAVPSTNINDLTDYPFGFNGQIKTDVGYGSGVAVQTNVVLTAAHLVFNDRTLSYVSGAFWYFQRQAGLYEPTPIQAQGWYVLSGYAAQRTNDLNSGLYGPDQSTAQSRNLDVAALYFSTTVAGGGYGGFLPSDDVPNSWLSSTSLKMLVGYPVDGSVFGDTSIVPGVMYQTTPQPYPLSRAGDQVDDQQVYVAPWLLSYPGNSGGPFYVQFNGYYYPAGVYLGTLYNGIVPAGSFVRAIDSNVVNMITLAQQLGDAGTNNTGGGVITIVPVQGISGKNLGHIQFRLSPQAAVRAGAGWKLHTDPPDAFGSDPNYTLAVDSTNDLLVEFKPIAGWNLPTNQTVHVFPGTITTNTAFYTVISPIFLSTSLIGQTFSVSVLSTMGIVYVLESKQSLSALVWTQVDQQTGTGNTITLRDNGAVASVRFYRIRAHP